MQVLQVHPMSSSLQRHRSRQHWFHVRKHAGKPPRNGTKRGRLVRFLDSVTQADATFCWIVPAAFVWN